MAFETAFSMDTSSIKFGPGVTREVGHDMRQMGGRRVMVVTDPVPGGQRARRRDARRPAATPASTPSCSTRRASSRPTPRCKEAVRFAVDGRFDGYVAVGGGSSIDTAKAADLYASCPADFLAYVNPPIGEGRPVPGKLAPLIAIPTTAGTGSETTGVIVFDLPELHAKTAIRQRAARPVLGIIDPLNTRDSAADGGGVQRPRRALPRARVAHGVAVRLAGRRRETRDCGRPTRARTRSATSGRRAPSRWAAANLGRVLDDPG